MNEAETRAELIDPALKAAGWGVVDGSRIRREHSISPGRIEGRGRRGMPRKADYVLEYRNTKLAVIEAKADTEEVSEGVGQAKDYAGKLALLHGKGLLFQPFRQSPALKHSQIATLRGRLGYSTGPALLYVTGGAAWVKVKDFFWADNHAGVTSIRTLSGLSSGTIRRE